MTENRNNNIYPYKEAKLISQPKGSDKKWYVEFWAWCVKTGKIKRKRLFQVNNHKNHSDRINFGQKQVSEINKLLIEGFHFDEFQRKEDSRKELLSIGKLKLSAKDALTEMHEKTKGAFRKKTQSGYKSKLKSFVKFLDIFDSDIEVGQINATHARNYVNYLTNHKKLANITSNSKIIYIRSLFDKLVDDQIIESNPFEKIKLLPELQSNSHEVYNDKMIASLKEIITKEDPQLWNFIQIIFYCYLRPKELRELKIKHFLLEKNQVYIPAYISKNKRDYYIYMPDSVKEIILEMDIKSKPKDNYLFGLMEYGSERPLGTNNMYNRHKKFLNKLNIEGEYTLYSWKHTGVVKAYNSGIDIKAIQRQCRHHSIEMTDKYLRSLGFGENVGFASKINNIKI